MRPGYIWGCDRSDVTNAYGSETGWLIASAMRGQGSQLGIPRKKGTGPAGKACVELIVIWVGP